MVLSEAERTQQSPWHSGQLGLQLGGELRPPPAQGRGSRLASQCHLSAMFVPIQQPSAVPELGTSGLISEMRSQGPEEAVPVLGETVNRVRASSVPPTRLSAVG